jgi:uncharacterized protein YciI
MRCLYFYLMTDASERVAATVPTHARYWHDLELPGYEGGPFADHSGGLITFEADSVRRAEGFIADDPFVLEDVVATSWVKEWVLD